MAVSLPEVDAPAIVGRASCVYTATLTGPLVISTAIVANTLRLDPGGADRLVTLPAVATYAGVTLRIVNTADAGEALTVQNAGEDVIGVITRDSAADFHSDGTSWVMATAIERPAYALETLAEARVLSQRDARNQRLDPGGAHRDVTLPPVAGARGQLWRIVNAADAAENLVCKNVGGDTIGTVNQSEQGEFYCNGSTWVLYAITAIALT